MENKVEKRIYKNYAFSGNKEEKYKINHDIYKELQEKYKIKQLGWNQRLNDLSEEEFEKYDIIYSREIKYHHSIYNLYKKPEEITENELLLIFDNGNLCFDGRRESSTRYCVFEY